MLKGSTMRAVPPGIFALFSLAAMVLLSSSGFAQGPQTPPRPAIPRRAACAVFVDRYCANVPFGEGRRIACLAKHKSQLDEPCRKRLAIMEGVFAFGKEQQEKNRKYRERQKQIENSSKKSPAQDGPAAPKKPGSN